jgi:hypothetical protein
MELVDFKAWHYRKIKPQAAQMGLIDAITDDYLEALADPETATSYTLIEGEKPLVCFGMIPLWENRAYAWAMLDESAKHYLTKITKVVGRALDYHSKEVKRIEAAVDCEFKEGHRWLKMLGFTLECDRMKAYRPDGKDAALYAKVG